MAYRNGTYIAFHANNTPNPSESDMKYYNTLRMWKVRDESDFKFINSHEKRDIRDSSTKETLRRALMERMNNSKHLLLIIGDTTRYDRDWIPFEISHAIDNCEIPVIAAYPGYNRIMNPSALSELWPKALADRINNGTAKVIHIPFRKEPIADAVSQFDFNNLPRGGLSYYSKDAYLGWGDVF
ncbi:MAG: TIR domain-containing protein [Candidatus Taylorbacteria bacterium]|nr:TIR domain-containing protein [Candidatus Taylorbacteria bacterium]